jgi:hypothetical protein
MLAADAAKRLKMKPGTLRQWVCRGMIRVVKPSLRITLVPIAEVERIEADRLAAD